jgi:hypothetical protein
LRKDADRHDDEVDAVEELRLAESEARACGKEIGADAGDPQADQHGEQRLDEGFTREQNDHREAERHQREIFG